MIGLSTTGLDKMQIEARYIDVKWDDARNVVQLQASPSPLPLQEDKDSTYFETITYTKKYFFIAFRVLDAALLHTPFFSLNHTREELLKVEDPGTGYIWWIQNGIWDSEKRRYLVESYRTAGKLFLTIQNQQITIYNHTNNFTADELEYFLQDFKNNLWEIIFNSQSVISADIRKNTEKNIPNIFDRQSLNFLDYFIDAVEKVLKEPKFFLQEIQGKLNRNKVKPIPRTFRELTTKPDAQQLSSRLHQSSYDTPENRYIHYCVDRISVLIQQATGVADALTDKLSETATHYQSEIEDLSQRLRENKKKISKEVFENEINDLIKNKNEIKNNIDKLCQEIIENSPQENNLRCNLNNYRNFFSIGANYGKATNVFFCNHLDKKDFRKKYGTFLTIKFQNEVSEKIQKIKEIFPDVELEIYGSFMYEDNKETAKSKVYCQFEVFNILEISASNLEESINKKKNKKLELESKNWIEFYSFAEKEEIRQEINTLNKRKAAISQRSERYKESTIQFGSRTKKIRDLKIILHGLKIKTSHHFPNNMVFIQNPHYSAAHKYFKSIIKNSNIKRDDLEQLIEISQLGLIAISVLYERWVLLQIIKALTEDFGFKIEPDWQSKLIKAVALNQTGTSLKLYHLAHKITLELFYEKTLKNGRRPDFILDIYSKEFTRNPETNLWKPSNNLRPARLVMDAKFYDIVNDVYLEKTLNELINIKNYGEHNSNRVFIIHSSIHPIPIEKITSPLVWNRDCDYGHHFPKNHSSGYISLVPSIAQRQSMDNLKRLLLLHLQSQTTVLHQDGIQNKEPPSWHNFWCPSCGSSQDRLAVKCRKTIAENNSWTIVCNECNHQSSENFCYSCKTRLFKNSFHWTYHRTYAEQITNCRCPQCNSDLNGFSRR